MWLSKPGSMKCFKDIKFMVYALKSGAYRFSKKEAFLKGWFSLT